MSDMQGLARFRFRPEIVSSPARGGER